MSKSRNEVTDDDIIRFDASTLLDMCSHNGKRCMILIACKEKGGVFGYGNYRSESLGFDEIIDVMMVLYNAMKETSLSHSGRKSLIEDVLSVCGKYVKKK